MTPRHIVLGLALLGAAGLALFGDRTPRINVAEPVMRTASNEAAKTTTPAKPGKPVKEPAILELTPREQLIGGAHAETQGAVLFASQSWDPPPPPPPPPPKPVPPPPPTAPPLPFQYVGKKNEAGQWEVYLAKGEQTHIVRASSIIDETYRVDAIAPPVLTLTYLPLKQVQTLSIGAAE